MKNIVLLFLLLFALSCSNKKGVEPLFNGLEFKLNKSESIGFLDLNVKDKYTTYFGNVDIQLPLFRYIKHNNYDIFIGLPYNTSIEAMIQNQLNAEDSLITNTFFKSDSLHYYKTYKKENFYLAEYAVKKENNSLIYISAISDSEESINKLNLSKRISINE